MKTNIHIVSHTHWDREWFLAAHYTREWLPKFFEALFEILEHEPTAKFVLDGQLVMIEDYFELLAERQQDSLEARQRLQALVRKGQIILGPYYLQPDWQLISEESAVRNLLAGKRLAAAYGPMQKMGWLLDCFGQIAQTSQLHAGFGLEGVFVWRGVALEPQNVCTEFIWESPDGTRLPSSYLLDSYRNAMRLCWDPDLIEGRIKYIAHKLEAYSSTKNILFMNGYDQEMEPENIAALLPKYPKLPAKLSSPAEYMGAVLAAKPKLNTLKGALYSGRYISVFPGILSTRMPIKQRNYHSEKLVERYVEPLAALAELAGGRPYPLAELQENWCTVMKNHPHDTICGVSIDALYRDLEERCNKSDSFSQELIKEALLQLLGGNKDESELAFSIYNPSGLARKTALVELPAKLLPMNKIAGYAVQRTANAGLLLAVEEIPGLALSPLHLAKEPKKGARPRVELRRHNDEVYLDNGILEVRIYADGCLDLYDLSSKTKFSKIHYFEDGADAGDTYNYSPCEEDQIISSKGLRGELEILETGPLRARVLVKLELAIPASLDESRKMRSSKLRNLLIRTVISLEAASQQLSFRTELNNVSKDHRLRVCFPTQLKAKLSHAETQFAITEHEIEQEAYSDEGLSTELKKILLGAREPAPVSCFPQRLFVDLSDGEKGLAVINKGLPEYEILPKERSIALTLFRSVGWLARTDLLERIGDAGPFIATPRAQVLESMSFEYALCPHRGDWEEGELLAQAEQFNYPVLLAPGTPCLTSAIDLSQGLFADKLPKHLKLSAFKKSEDGSSFILRLTNYSKNTRAVLLSFAIPIEELEELDLAENSKDLRTVLSPLKCNLEFRPFEIKTLSFKLRNNSSVELHSAYADLEGRMQDCSIFWQDFDPKGRQFAKLWEVQEREALVSPQELETEEQRSRTLSIQVAEIRAQWEKARPASREKIDLEMQLYSLERAYEEALISSLYLRESLENPAASKDSPELEKQMHEIGLRLNKARVNKRAFEYIHQYKTEVLGL